jgi:hypothetical protein
MADIFTVGSPGTAILPLKALIGLYNNQGSGKVLKVYKIWALNNQTAAVTGPIATTINIERVKELSGGIALNYLKHNSKSANLPAQISCATGATYALTTPDSVLRRLFWQTAEPFGAGIAGSEDFQTIPALMLIWDTGYDSAGTVEPIVLRDDEGIIVKAANTANGATTPIMDLFIEFEAV